MSIEFLGGTRAGPGGQSLPFSPAVKAGPFVFVSGQVALGDNGELVPGGIEAQTRQALKNVEKALVLAGCTLKDVVKATVWLDGPRLLDVQPGLRRTFPESKPARSTMQAKLMIDARSRSKSSLTRSTGPSPEAGSLSSHGSQIRPHCRSLALLFALSGHADSRHHCHDDPFRRIVQNFHTTFRRAEIPSSVRLLRRSMNAEPVLPGCGATPALQTSSSGR
jgi:enamine deaminase RidA (YjgF/YER057c/UK114 family)